MNDENKNITSDEEQACVFCSIVDGAAPADIVFDGGDTLFFRDISPKAPTHIVGIPKKHIRSMAEMKVEDQGVAGKLLRDAALVARDEGIEKDGYRLITNVGAFAGQVVPHLHFHILGGEPLGPLRC